MWKILVTTYFSSITRKINSKGFVVFNADQKKLPSKKYGLPMEIKELYQYPLKSTRGVTLETTEILKTGFKHDRCIAVIDKKNRVVTGRERPELLKIRSKIEMQYLRLSIPETNEFSFALPHEGEVTEVKLFRNPVLGRVFSAKAANWISNFLNDDFRLVFIDNAYNLVQEKRGGKVGEYKAYSDSSPIHLINLRTLDCLNSSLKSAVGVRNFRSNIVVDGMEAFEEDTWSTVEINGCRFRAQERTSRCIFTTINPETSKKNRNMQPLSELAQIRLKMGLRPTFGIGLVPLGEGFMSLGDELKIIAKT